MCYPPPFRVRENTIDVQLKCMTPDVQSSKVGTFHTLPEVECVIRHTANAGARTCQRRLRRAILFFRKIYSVYLLLRATGTSDRRHIAGESLIPLNQPDRPDQPKCNKTNGSGTLRQPQFSTCGSNRRGDQHFSVFVCRLKK